MSNGYIPEEERPSCPACGATPEEIVERNLNVWWCPTSGCRVHQFEGETDD